MNLFEAMARRMAAADSENEDFIPPTVEELQEQAKLYDDRSFAPGAVVTTRKDIYKKYTIPRPGTPALVIGKIEPKEGNDGDVYTNEAIVVLAKSGDRFYRFSADPVFFELYVPPVETAAESATEDTASTAVEA